VKRPREINIVIGIGIFTVIMTAACWFLWFAVPGVVQSCIPGDAGFAVHSTDQL